MRCSTPSRTFRQLAAVLGGAVLVLTACNPNSSTGSSVANSTRLPSPEDSQATSPAVTGSATTAERTVVDHFGDSCDKIPTDPTDPTSFAAMGDKQAASALAKNPLTGKLYQELETAHLVTTLNTANGLTILAPSDDAFAKLGEARLRALESDTTELTRVLEYHVITKRLSPDELTGQISTLQGSPLSFHGSKPDISVAAAAGQAHIVCGNIITQNATVYVIDSVLLPPGALSASTSGTAGPDRHYSGSS